MLPKLGRIHGNLLLTLGWLGWRYLASPLFVFSMSEGVLNV